MKPPVPPRHGTPLSRKQEEEALRKMRNAVSNARRKKPPITLPAVKTISED